MPLKLDGHWCLELHLVLVVFVDEDLLLLSQEMDLLLHVSDGGFVLGDYLVGLIKLSLDHFLVFLEEFSAFTEVVCVHCIALCLLRLVTTSRLLV